MERTVKIDVESGDVNEQIEWFRMITHWFNILFYDMETNAKY